MRSIYRVFLAASILGFGVPLAAQVPQRSKPTSRPQTYGASAVSYVEVPAVEFLPGDSSIAYTTNSAWEGRYSTNCGGACFDAPLHLPAGAQVVYLELDSYDTNATSWAVGSLVACDWDSQNCTFHPTAGAGPADCLTAGFICSGNAFASGVSAVSADLTSEGIIVDNFISSYRLVAGGYSFDTTTHIGGMIVGYILQVSPDPSFATFADVPVGHPFHRFVEALYASGITAGCGGGNFCPDSPLTRGQMAVFLSVALGLQWN